MKSTSDGGEEAKLSPKLIKKVIHGNQLEINFGLSSCGGFPSSFSAEGYDSQQGTIESTDGHMTAPSKGKFTGLRVHSLV